MLIRERRVIDTVQADATTRATLMRGSDGMQEGLFTLAKLEDFVPANHPLRAIRVAGRCALSLVTHDERLAPNQVREWLSIHEEIVHSTIEVQMCHRS